MFCEKCGETLREGAKFCPECGLMVENTLSVPNDEYSYETIQNLFPWSAVIPIVLLVWLPFTVIGLMVAMAEGFWFVPVIMSSIVLLGIFLIAWANKGKKEKWGVDRTLWIITPEGYGNGYPPDVAKRLAALGITSAAASIGSNQNWGVISHSINMAKNINTVIKGLKIIPWTEFISAEYRAEKHEIALHTPKGQVVGLIHTNSDNYAHVEQLVREYMIRR